ncbi:hypothetical protein [Candidatus Nitrosopumilus sediminis]|uniref:Uncharacterized protein n=1 Tax=Candidatus Nitrosopumilus sediminis TaxID=1229909 RepID=K0BBX1_9ARCH|nr:hypothetical protein [Candidatus Nitrosopumilus sediminis]AFS82632.1 hypothetical protein NSED_04130 [Candidatus Nitrosopumilus sediminis]
MTYTIADLKILDQVMNDIDLQLKDFNYIIPYEYNQEAYSPRLVNLLLTTCIVIERYCKILQIECQLPEPDGNGGIRGVLRNLDGNGVLANMKWTTSFNEEFQPFDGTYAWWQMYNDTKHEETFSITDVKYRQVVTAILALHSLQRLAWAKLTTNWTKLNGMDLLDIEKWDEESDLSWSTRHGLFHTYSGPKKER